MKDIIMKEITTQQEYRYLIEECSALISERKFDLAIRDLEWRHELGSLIHNSELYQNSNNKTEFIQRLAKDINVSAPLLYQLLEFYRKFPDFDKFLSEFKPEKKGLRWADVRLLLVENPTKCKHEKIYEERIMIVRKKCEICGHLIEEIKSKL